MPPTILNHTCGWYCAPPTTHAVEAIGLKHISPEEILRGYNEYCEQGGGWRAVAIRPAPEADPAAWMPLMGWYYDPQSKQRHMGHGCMPLDEVLCWLVTLQWKGDNNGAGEPLPVSP